MAEKTSKGYAIPGTGEGSGGLTDEDGNPVMTEMQKEIEAENQAREKRLNEERKKRMQGTVKKAYGGKAMKMADGKMVKKKKKTTKVARRRGDGCAVRGKTKGRMV
jgi:hypothetical protein